MSEASSGNRNHLLKLWAWPLSLFGVILTLVVAAVSRPGTDLTRFYTGAGVGVFLLGLARVLRARARRRFAELLLEPTPEPLLAYTRTSYNRTGMPHADLQLANLLAIQRTIYGQFGRALDELDLRDWNAAPAMYRASMLQARALVHYLSRDDTAAGLRAAKEAERLAEVPRFVPGVRQQHRRNQLYIDIGRVLCEGASPELADALDRRAAEAKLPLDHAISLWACALVQASLGNEAKAAELRARIAKLAPHCEPLHHTDAHARAAPGEIAARAADAAEARSMAAGEHPRLCALHVDVIAEACCIRCGNFACKQCARAVSDVASICAACTARYRELRERNLVPERGLRAAGLLLQLSAICLGAFMTLGVVITSFFQFQPSSLIFLAFVGLMTGAVWYTGRNIREMRANWRIQLQTSALPLLMFVPLGSLLAGGALWQLHRAPFDAEQASEYHQAVRVTPELAPKSLWPLALGAAVALIANAAFLLFVLIGRN